MKQYLQLFLNGVGQKSTRPGKCFVVAFTSSNSGEGVSYVTESFGVELARRIGKRTLVADAERLSRLNMFHYTQVARFCSQTDVPNLWFLTPDDEEDAETEASTNFGLQAYAESNLEQAYNNLQTLRFAFDYVLLDCPALSESDEATFLAPETDGVMVVVEADRTRKQQIQNTQQTIESANGNLLGFILNKRQYTVPKWLYNRL
jgi:Mrp family chromosome partitioning ATPase